ncbi:MAG: sodium/hydrogen exchanger, partial [Rhodocyclales bacterium]|nr:sodium/hydrogen exchanger [Rhodocyclales bacterium]
CSVVAKRLHVPDIVLYLLAGMALGPAAAGVVHVPAAGTLNQILLTFGASYLLFDGGASLRFKVLKEVWITIVVISTLGVLITGAITAGVAIAVGLPAMTALLLGAVIASTDPATLVPIFKQVRIRDRVAQTVMSESAFNDAMGAIATFTVLGIFTGSGEAFSLGVSLRALLWQSGLGILIGGTAGYLACLLTGHEKFGFMREHLPLVTLMAVIGAYLTADGLQSSGFMAVFVFGIMLGNRDSFGFALDAPEQAALDDFIGTTTLIMRIFIFVLLGSQVDFALLRQYWPAGVLIVALFMGVARPVTVFLCAGADRRARWSFKEMLFMSWTRETGVIPAALAGMLIGLKVPGAEVVSAITFIAILMTILIQAPTTRWLAHRLGLLEE